MNRQCELEQFYIDNTQGEISESQHKFIRGKNIYFHGTSYENFENIVKNGFNSRTSNFDFCYFSCSFFISQSYASKHVKYVVFAVDLNEIIKQNDNVVIWGDGGDIKIRGEVSSEYIVGYIDFPRS